ncbi:hypothetical protein [Streptomyces vinaceus]|uniref:hypothetical protein n=1 Tax=Streptomyces vinaceus TaxID=1960 RepID=UPI0036B03BFA
MAPTEESPTPARYRIAAAGPVTGGVMGVAFANGQAVADSERDARALAWFRAQPDYRVELIEDPQPEQEHPAGADLAATPSDRPGTPAPEPDTEPTEPAADEPPAARRKGAR